MIHFPNTYDVEITTGNRLTHADLTWFPTCVYMEYLMPKVFQWTNIFQETIHFPKLTKWYQNLTKNPIFSKVHQDLYNHWAMRDTQGLLDIIREETKDTTYKWKYP